MKSKYLGGLMGFVIGDAFGVPVEFMSRHELLKNPVTKMIGNGTYNLPAGTWSDDTSMMIATIDSINSKQAIDLLDIALKFVAWKNHATYTALGEVFDIGNTCLKAISNFEESHNPTTCGLKDINSNGNGSLMRILPIAYYAVEKRLKEDEILSVVREISSLTHAHEISIMGCYIYIRYAIFLLNGKDKYSAYSMLKSVDYSMFSEETQSVYNRILNDDLSKLTINDISSSGYIVDSLESALWVTLKSENFKEAIIGAVNLGEDTDTIGALTGGLSGIIYGDELIPEDWKNAIARKEYLLDIFEEFYENKYE